MDYPSLEEAQAIIAHDMQGMLGRLQGDLIHRAKVKNNKFDVRHRDLVKHQQVGREALKTAQEKRRIRDNKMRQARFRAGISGVWDRLRGEHKRIQIQNEREAYATFRQDRRELDELVFSHLKERKHIKIFKLRIQERANHMRHGLKRDMRSYGRDTALKTRNALEP